MSRSIEIVLTVSVWAVVAFLGLRLLIRWLRRVNNSRHTTGRPPVIVELDKATMLEIKAAIEQMKFIEALKLYQTASGQSLAESRDALNYLVKNDWKMPSTIVSPQSVSQTVSMDQVNVLVQQNRLIDAIKMYRQLTGCDLKTAKDAVDTMAAHRQQR